MNKSFSIILSLSFSLCLPYQPQAQIPRTVAGVVERILKEKEPEWNLESGRGSGGGQNPNEAEPYKLLKWRRKGQEVAVSIHKMKTKEQAEHIFSVSTITSIMRKGYELTDAGEKLERIVDECGFFRNSSGAGIKSGLLRRETYEVAFRKRAIVIVVEARDAKAAQRFALHIAEMLTATQQVARGGGG